MTNERFFKRLDTMVEWTGIPTLAKGTPRRRPLRGPATLALILAIAGYVMVLASRPMMPWGLGILMLGFSIANFIKIFRPLKPFGAIEQVDEWDRATRSRSIEFTYMIVSVTMPLGLVVLAAVAQWRNWDMPTLAQTVMATGFLLMALFSAMPTAHASWAVRWSRDGDQAD